MRGVGFKPCNREFGALMVAATEAALQGGSTPPSNGPPSGRLHFHMPSDVAEADVASRDGGATVVDLHGLSTGEARAAVLSRLSALQVIITMSFPLPNNSSHNSSKTRSAGTDYNQPLLKTLTRFDSKMGRRQIFGLKPSTLGFFGNNNLSCEDLYVTVIVARDHSKAPDHTHKIQLWHQPQV